MIGTTQTHWKARTPEPGRHIKRAMTARKSASMSDWLEKKQKEPGR